MANIPSKFRTDKLLAIAKNLSLTDPYRIIHPVKREFTYVPNARMNLNRSRIDYFLIKSDQIDKIIKCDIAHALSSTSFDHKKISLTIGKRRGKNDFNKINTSLLKNRGVNLLVKSKVLESYVVHADPDAVPGFQIRSLLIDIGRIERLIREWIKNNDDLQTIELAEAIFEQLPQLHFFETLPLTSSDDFFFEGMVSAVRTSLLSVQASIHLEKNKALKELSIELSSLKNNYDNNSLQIKKSGTSSDGSKRILS
jgi:hypothetical protein